MKKRKKWKDLKQSQINEAKAELLYRTNDFVAMKNIGTILGINPDDIDLNDVKGSLYKMIDDSENT